MKYRIKDNSISDAFSFLFLWWLIIPFGSVSEPYSVEYKKHWWNRWKTYEENGIPKCFKTHWKAQQFITNLKKHEKSVN